MIRDHFLGKTSDMAPSNNLIKMCGENTFSKLLWLVRVVSVAMHGVAKVLKKGEGLLDSFSPKSQKSGDFAIFPNAFL